MTLPSETRATAKRRYVDSMKVGSANVLGVAIFCGAVTGVVVEAAGRVAGATRAVVVGFDALDREACGRGDDELHPAANVTSSTAAGTRVVARTAAVCGPALRASSDAGPQCAPHGTMRST